MDVSSEPLAGPQNPPPGTPNKITLSSAAKLIYQLLKGWKRVSESKGKGPIAYPERSRLAAEAKVTIRTVTRALAQLQAAGLIWMIDRPGKSSIYFFSREELENFQSCSTGRERRGPMKARQEHGSVVKKAQKYTQEYTSTRDNVVPPTRDNVVPPTRDNVVPPTQDNVVPTTRDHVVPTTRDHVVPGLYISAIKHKEKAVAAAASFLVNELHVPAQKIETAEHSLVIAIAEHMRERLADQQAKPIGPGYVFGCLKSPEKFFFRKRQGVWQKPVEANLAAVFAHSFGQRKAQEARERALNRPDVESHERARLAWWQAIPEAQRTAILEEIRRRAPPNSFLTSLPDDSAFIVDQCIRKAEELHRGGLLDGPSPPTRSTSSSPPTP